MDHLLSSSRGFGPGELTSSCPYTGITLQGNSERVSRNSEAAYHALKVASNVLIHSQFSSSVSFLLSGGLLDYRLFFEVRIIRELRSRVIT